MELTELFRNFGSLFETFQWWSLLLIIGVVLVMIPINMLLKKIMKSETTSRLRKIVAFLSVYVISTAVVALFTAIATETTITATYLFGSALALGFCSQFAWEIIKLIRDYGFKKFVAWAVTKIDENKAAGKIAEKYKIDKSLVKTLIVEAKAKMNEDIDEIEKAFVEDTQIMNELHERLSNIVDANNLESAVKEVYALINNK